VPGLAGARVLYRDGAPVATLVAGVFAALEPMDAAAEWVAKTRLLRGDTATDTPVETETESEATH
jgi:ATP-dependent helicase Lhr and Lhr-like helicase